jgi:hypothetical protein
MLVISLARRSPREVVSPLDPNRPGSVTPIRSSDLTVNNPDDSTLRRSHHGQPRSCRRFQRQSESHVPYCHRFAHSFVKTPGVGGTRKIESSAKACTRPATGTLLPSHDGQPRSSRRFQRQSESYMLSYHGLAHSFVKTPGVGGTPAIEILAQACTRSTTGTLRTCWRHNAIIWVSP